MEQHKNPQPEQAKEESPAQQQGDAAPSLSKRQQKRLLKMERLQEVKKARKKARKEAHKEAVEQKRSAIDSMLASMTEQEREQWHSKNKEKQQQMAAERAVTKARHQQALSAPNKVVIDLDFPGLMTPGELKSLCQQISYSYHVAVSAAHQQLQQGQEQKEEQQREEPEQQQQPQQQLQQLHLHLLGATAEIDAALLRQLPGHVNWSATKSDKGFLEFFKDRKQDLVYLTADSPDELQVLDPAKIYLLGGLVDRNRHKGICYKKAQEAGVATARFPITQHFRLHTSAVITVNQCVDIMVRMVGAGQEDWKGVLEAVLPMRKLADGGSGGSGSGSKEASPAPPQAAAAAAAAAEEEEGSGAAAAAEGSEPPAAAAAAAAPAAEQPVEGRSS